MWTFYHYAAIKLVLISFHLRTNSIYLWNIGEAFTFGRFSCISTEHNLVNIPLQMAVAHVMVADSYHPYECSRSPQHIYRNRG